MLHKHVCCVPSVLNTQREVVSALPHGNETNGVKEQRECGKDANTGHVQSKQEREPVMMIDTELVSGWYEVCLNKELDARDQLSSGVLGRVVQHECAGVGIVRSTKKSQDKLTYVKGKACTQYIHRQGEQHDIVSAVRHYQSVHIRRSEDTKRERFHGDDQHLLALTW